jgi:hypothetical protein
MHALGVDARDGRRRPAVPGNACKVSLSVSYDQGESWQPCGSIAVPTRTPDGTARAFLVAAMTACDNSAAVWRVESAPAGAASVVLRSDGEPG